MRSSLLISAYLIANAININTSVPEYALVILMIFFLLLDVADFGKSLKIDFYRG